MPMPCDAPRRVVVTGVGSVSAVGIGGGEVVATALAQGVPAIGAIRGFSTEGSASHLAGEVGDLAPHLAADEIRRLSRVSQFAVIACRLALADAGVEPGAVPGLGLVLGSHYGDLRSSEAFARGFLARGPLGLSPLLFPSTVMNGMAAHAAIALGARGPMLTLNQSGIGGELAVARAVGLVATGRAPAVLAGGVDELSGILYREIVRLGGTSPGGPRGSGPEGCWPFDRRANGTVLGEGATVVLLEAGEVARARGARVYAEVRGAAWGNLPSPARGLPARRRRDPAVILGALERAAIGSADVDVIYLTGAGDPAQDACELDLIGAVFGVRRGGSPRLTALTPLAGEHAGLGGLRVAGAAVATLAGGRVPSLPDLQAPVRQGLPFATRATAGLFEARTVLVHGLARGGAHAALVLGRATMAAA